MSVTIGDLWIPAVWVDSMRERQATFPTLFASKVIARSDLFDKIASGPGISANVPFLKDTTDQDDEVQVENTDAVNDNGQNGDVQLFPIMNRVKKNSSGALAKQLSGADPMGAIIDQMTENRLKNRQKTMVSVLRGLFGSAGANGVNAALKGTRISYGGNEPFTENGINPGDQYLMSPDLFIDGKALMGELADTLKSGCLLMHTNVKARLEKLDALNFKTTVKPSELPFEITTYRDIPIFVSDTLVRNATNGGYVYDTYLIASGCVGYGEKPQQGDTADVASLQYFLDRGKNVELVWDRTRFMLGVNGTKWTGNAANVNNGPSNAELQNPANWGLVFQSANRCGAVCIRTNG